jgi:hypothetical protein
MQTRKRIQGLPAIPIGPHNRSTRLPAHTPLQVLAGHPRLAKANMIAGLKSRNLEKAFGEENL